MSTNSVSMVTNTIFIIFYDPHLQIKIFDEFQVNMYAQVWLFENWSNEYISLTEWTALLNYGIVNKNY